jgi:porphobilinogen synthase
MTEGMTEGTFTTEAFDPDDFGMTRPHPVRLRRLRRTEALRRTVRETRLDPAQFIWPLFVRSGQGFRQPIGSMPGVYQTSVDELLKDAQQAVDARIGGILLFGIPDTKDAIGSAAWDPHGPVVEAIRAVKKAFPQLLVITDVCMCEYTEHGHCGVLTSDGDVDNDATLLLLAKEAITHAEAGADMVAPSDMMDHRIGHLREALDDEGYSHVPIMSYAAKYASAFYGPFRDAAESTPTFGDRRSYQMDPANAREALREVRLDVEEGADILMVKPAGAYLDIIAAVKRDTGLPLCAYQVSGEYSMIKAAAERGWIDGERAMMESLVAIARAGADLIITYFAIDAAAVLARR